MTSDKLYSLILASQSPRRKELLGHLGVDFEVITSGVDEVTTKEAPQEISMDLAKLKGEHVLKELSSREDYGKDFFPLVIASDTVVAFEGEILGKPKDIDHARQTLLKLSDNSHWVYSAVYLGRLDVQTQSVQQYVFYDQTKVYFNHITHDLLENYLKTEDCMDKAGAYGIQGHAQIFISKIEGPYSNVVGLPLPVLVEQLKSFLGFLSDEQGGWRKVFKGS